jgi:hypothetical protein
MDPGKRRREKDADESKLKVHQISTGGSIY